MPPQKWVTKYQRKPGRWVFEPTDEYSAIGEGIRKAVAKLWRAPSYYFHLRAGGHVAALRRHAGKTYFARFDIEDFFGSVSRNRVARLLKELHFSYDDARQTAADSTVRHPTVPGRSVLPYGFIQSPILASVALSKSRLGSALDHLHQKVRAINISVYVDDIIVSCDDHAKLEEVCGVLTAAAKKSRLAFNPAKSQGPASAITAFNIELTHGNLEIEAERLAEFAAMLAATPSAQREQGIVSYVTSVNAAQAAALKPTTP
jgi:reverse transcriptase-like protein